MRYTGNEYLLIFNIRGVAMVLAKGDMQQEHFSDSIAVYVTLSMRGALTLLTSPPFSTPEESFLETDLCNEAEQSNETSLVSQRSPFHLLLACKIKGTRITRSF